MKSLPEGFVRSADKFPERPALEIGESSWTYEGLARIVGGIVRAISDGQTHTSRNNRFVALLAHRSIAAYSGLLATLLAGKAYVPLNPKFPGERNLTMLRLSTASTIIVGEECEEAAMSVLTGADDPLRVILLEERLLKKFQSRFPRHTYIPVEIDNDAHVRLEVPNVRPDDIAYLLFTSGSTGAPKGVAVSNANIGAYLDCTVREYGITYEDRHSQTPDLTFDLSVHDVFVTLYSGACLCCVPEKSLMTPAWFINEKRLTIWVSVPSIAMMMGRLRMLKPDRFPSLRLSLFCGEALPAGVAKQWQIAAPNSVVENLYGPTEATVAISRYRWDSERSPDQAMNGLVPIGEMFQSHRGVLLSESGTDVIYGEGEGELCVSGPQVTRGYYNDSTKTQEQFVTFPGEGSRRWYRTGDLVRRDRNGCMHFLGRIDNQVKIRGYRAELQEIEHVIRRAGETESAVAVAWPVQDGHAEGIVAFISGIDPSKGERIIEFCEKHLPAYMVPRRVIYIDQFPLSANGKIDRRRLAEGLDQQVYK